MDLVTQNMHFKVSFTSQDSRLKLVVNAHVSRGLAHTQSCTGILGDFAPFGGWFIVFETWSCHVAHVGFKLLVLLSQCPQRRLTGIHHHIWLHCF